MAAERQEEFAPGLDPELQELADAFTGFKENLITPKKKSIINKALGRIRQNVHHKQMIMTMLVNGD